MQFYKCLSKKVVAAVDFEGSDLKVVLSPQRVITICEPRRGSSDL